MPVIMPLSAVVVALLAIFSRHDPNVVMWLRIIAALCIMITIATTLIVSVPINNLTGKWPITEDLEKWSQMRKRWHFFQGIRGVLYLVSFILLTIASVIQRHP